MPITLLTDFDVVDTYIGQMKGVIAGVAPDTTVVDLTHAIPPQDVLAGALELGGAVNAFPSGTIHVAVVDPGVGTQRRPIAVQTDRFTFVGPDNGVFSAVIEQSRQWEAVALTQPAYHRGRTSATFHGRDIFSPVAAHLAKGVELAELGEPVPTPKRLHLPEPAQQEGGLVGEVVLIDGFGNLISNITEGNLRAAGLDAAGPMRIEAGDARLDRLDHTFGDVNEGEPVAYVGSGGRLEVAVRNGSAVRQLNAARGTRIAVFARDSRPANR